MVFLQKEIALKPYPRGFHSITSVLLRQCPNLSGITKGLLHVFIKHTSAGICINEDADPTVREDFESFFNHLVPENEPYFKHNYEGPDDMPAHLKAALLGNSITIPITNGNLNLGTWQGVYLCEHRNNGGSRKLVLTACGS